MIFVPQSRLLPRLLWRPALFFFAVAQIFVSFAPLFEVRQGPESRAHIEESGTTLHHAHNDAECAACTARGLLSSSDPETLRTLLKFVSRGSVPAVSLESFEEARRSALERHARLPLDAALLAAARAALWKGSASQREEIERELAQLTPESLRVALKRHLDETSAIASAELVARRYDKYRAIGVIEGG
jgi:hypothetical protein